MYCCSLCVGTVKQLFCPTCFFSVYNYVDSALQSRSTFTVKMSATKKKELGVRLGVVTEQVELDNSVALIRMAVQLDLGRLKRVMPQMAQRVSGRWQKCWLNSVADPCVPLTTDTPELKVVTGLKMQLDEQSSREPRGQVPCTSDTSESYLDITKATLMYSIAPSGLWKETTGPKGEAPTLTVTAVQPLLGTTGMVGITPAERQSVVLRAEFHMKPMMYAWMTTCPPPNPEAVAAVLALQAGVKTQLGSEQTLQLPVGEFWQAAPTRSTATGVAWAGLVTSATVAQMSEQAPLRLRLTTMQVKLTRFQRVMELSAGLRKLTTTRIRVFWFSKATLSTTRVQKELEQPVWKPVREKPQPRTSMAANWARARSWQQSLLAPLLQVSKGLRWISPVASLGMIDAFWQVLLKSVCPTAAVASRSTSMSPFMTKILFFSKWKNPAIYPAAPTITQNSSLITVRSFLAKRQSYHCTRLNRKNIFEADLTSFILDSVSLYFLKYWKEQTNRENLMESIDHL